MSNLQIPDKLKPLLLKPKRFKVIIGGRGSAKSTSVGNIFLMKIETEQADVLCLREFQGSIEDSVHKLMKNGVEKLGVSDRFYITDNKVESIASGKGTRYKGASRNSSAIKSAEGYKYSWFEEAQTASKQTLEDLLPTIRAEGSELWFTGNPQSSGDPFSQRFIVPYLEELEKHSYYEDDLHMIIVINWRDNPWFPKELEQQRLWDYENLPRAKYDHIWEGKFNDTVDNAIIQPEWFDACVDAHIKLGIEPTGVEVVAHDPSDEGDDTKGLAYRHGVIIKDVLEKENGNINDGGDWAAAYAIQNQIDVFTWDCDGMGVGLNRQMTQSLSPKKITLDMFKGSNAAKNPNAVFEKIGDKVKLNKDAFMNQRAQGYWYLRERMRKTYLAVEKGEYIDPSELISISGEIKLLPSIRSEVCRIPTKDNSYGKIQILSKPEMKKLGIKSPNLADSIMMAMMYEVKITKQYQIRDIPTNNAY
jgi:phage terminase large subunit